MCMCKGGKFMQICEVFGKRVGHGNMVSHSHRATKRIWRPNLQTMTLNVDGSENIKR